MSTGTRIVVACFACRRPNAVDRERARTTAPKCGACGCHLLRPGSAAAIVAGRAAASAFSARGIPAVSGLHLFCEVAALEHPDQWGAEE